jgi:hypothetical protein
MKKERKEQRIYFLNQEKLYRLNRCDKCNKFYPHKTIFSYAPVINDDNICVDCFMKKNKKKELCLFFIDE